MKLEIKILAAVLTVSFSVMSFALSAFYDKVDDGLVEIAKINTNIAVAVNEISSIKDDVRDNKLGIKENRDDIKKFRNGMINLTTRVGYLESHK